MLTDNLYATFCCYMFTIVTANTWLAPSTIWSLSKRYSRTKTAFWHETQRISSLSWERQFVSFDICHICLYQQWYQDAKQSLDNSNLDHLLQILQTVPTQSSLLHSVNAEKLCICKIRSMASVLCLNRSGHSETPSSTWNLVEEKRWCN